MSIFITNNIEQESANLISMYTDIGYVKKRILQSYPNLSLAKQNTYCTNAISINGRAVKMSKIVCLYLCYYAFSMLVRYHPEKWKAFCESSDIAIIRKLLINCRREMLVDVIQLLSGKEYSFTTVMEEMDAELDASEVYNLVKEEAWREYKRTGRNTLIF